MASKAWGLPNGIISNLLFLLIFQIPWSQKVNKHISQMGDLNGKEINDYRDKRKAQDKGTKLQIYRLSK